MKGIVLAGGSGTRLYPVTNSVSKQLLPVYDKPMVYYPISVLMLAGIKDILIISTPHDLPAYKNLLGTGEHLGVNFEYIEQPRPEGLAQAFVLGKEFIGNDDVCLVLGDNVFYGAGLVDLLSKAKLQVKRDKSAVIFGSYVKNPESYGVAEFDNNNNVLGLEEKPLNPKSSYAVVGLYFYPNDCKDIVLNVERSERGEYEITSLNNEYLHQKRLKLEVLSRGFAWLDTGTHESLMEANEFVKSIENRTGLKLACLEEIALNFGWTTKNVIEKKIENISSKYCDYIRDVIKNIE